jgi:flavin-binding protein dodecin
MCRIDEIRDIIGIKGKTGEWQSEGGGTMAVARVTEIIASSTKSFEDAINEGVDRAGKTLRGITGVHVVALKAAVEDGKISEYRAQMNITFILEG